jgi:plasmid maintenance system antidote protein VapI
MSNLTGFNPNWASMPGDTIANILNERQLSLLDFSKMMESSLTDINNLLHGYISINEPIAKKLNKCIGGSTEFWLRREEQYRSDIRRLGDAEKKKWIGELPIADMIKLKWIPKNADTAESLLKYFAVPDVWTWRKRYSDMFAFISFRKSSKILSTPGSLLTWLRQGEIQADEMECENWDREKFFALLPQLKRLTRLKDPKAFLPKLRSECAKCGVAIAIAPTPTGCAASGLAKFITPQKALILLSFRYKSDDQFWFTFFHEAGHLILHGEGKIFIEEDKPQAETMKEEGEANRFAEEILIPSEIRNELMRTPITERSLKTYANKANISLGILVGQLQFLGRVSLNHFNSYKRRYNWVDINSSLNQSK